VALSQKWETGRANCNVWLLVRRRVRIQGTE